MRGDVSIIEGKLCYAFDVSDVWLEKLNERSRFYRGKDEWKVKSIVDGVAWCYQIDPFRSRNKEVVMLSKKVDKLSGYINELIKENNQRNYEEYIYNEILCNSISWIMWIKIYINKLSRKIINRDIFKIPYSVGHAVKLLPKIL